MKLDEQNHRAPSARKELARTIDFDGHPVTAVLWRGRWWWPASQVGEAIGYAHGRKLVANIRGDWSADFVEGQDYEALIGESLASFRVAANDCTESVQSFPRGRGGARSLVILSESGIDLALVLSRTEKGRQLRRVLVDEVLPQLRATGSATLPGAPVLDGPAMAELVRALMKETGESIRAEIIAELRSAPPANHPLPFLDRAARGLVLNPLNGMAKLYAGAGAPPNVVSSHRGQITNRVRNAVDWHRKWCLFPSHRLGELRAALDGEQTMADRVAAALARERQLSLVPRPNMPPRGDA